VTSDTVTSTFAPMCFDAAAARRCGGPPSTTASALPSPDFYPDKLGLALRIGGQCLAARVTADHWRRAAAQLVLDEDTVLSRVARLAEQVPAALASAAAQPDVAARDSPLPQRLLDLVAQRCAVLGRRFA